MASCRPTCVILSEGKALSRSSSTSETHGMATQFRRIPQDLIVFHLPHHFWYATLLPVIDMRWLQEKDGDLLENILYATPNPTRRLTF